MVLSVAQRTWSPGSSGVTEGRHSKREDERLLMAQVRVTCLSGHPWNQIGIFIIVQSILRGHVPALSTYERSELGEVR